MTANVPCAMGWQDIPCAMGALNLLDNKEIKVLLHVKRKEII